MDEKLLEVIKNFKILKFEEYWDILSFIVSINNPEQSIWPKAKKGTENYNVWNLKNLNHHEKINK